MAVAPSALAEEVVDTTPQKTESTAPVKTVKQDQADKQAAQDELNKEQSDEQKAQKALDEAQKANLEKAQADLTSVQTALEEAQANRQKARDTYIEKQLATIHADNSYEAAQKKLEEAEKAVDAAQAEYDKQKNQGYVLNPERKDEESFDLSNYILSHYELNEAQKEDLRKAIAHADGSDGQTSAFYNDLVHLEQDEDATSAEQIVRSLIQLVLGHSGSLDRQIEVGGV
ncbi:hypothetical protein HMPREF2909_07275 [Alloscardovia sp. HMSC034E08]|nr:hypothetical protein HMPREF2909_07275 [Alloscardovia sp. HMSC034E08]